MTPDNEPILVTGVAGFIGRAIAERLLEAGRPVVGTDYLEGAPDKELAAARLQTLDRRPGFSYYNVDLADRAASDALFRHIRPGLIAHMAARAGVRASIEEPHAFSRSNLEGFLNVLEGCRHGDCRHLVYASSSSVYGSRSEAPFRESEAADHPVSFYAATKRANELMAHSYTHLFGFPATGVRFFTVYGPWGRPDMAVFLFTKAIIEGQPITLYEGGSLERDFTYIDDVAEAVTRLLDHPPHRLGEADEGVEIGPHRAAAPHRVLNIGNRRAVRVRELVDIIERAVGRPAQIRALPMLPSDVPLTAADTDAIEAIAGFQPDTPLEEGVREFVDWYRAFYGV